MKNNLISLQNRIKVKFKNLDLLKKSITHKSFDPFNNYEKLEFLGDRVLGLSISKKITDLYSDDKVGNLDKRLASLVNKNSCYIVGKKLNLENYIIIGRSQKKNKIENKIISDCCEALIGAIYLDKGFHFSEKFVIKNWNDLIESNNLNLIDAKTKLQEYSLKKFKILPIYKVFSKIGPKHKPNFKVGVKLKNSSFVEANGSSIKQAEQAAAKIFLNKLNI